MNSLPCGLDYSSLQGAWPNEGDLPGNRGPWKSIEKVQQLLRELGIIRPSTRRSVKATFTAEMKATCSSPPQHLEVTPMSMLSHRGTSVLDSCVLGWIYVKAINKSITIQSIRQINL